VFGGVVYPPVEVVVVVLEDPVVAPVQTSIPEMDK
jgi:hypothetical protein